MFYINYVSKKLEKNTEGENEQRGKKDMCYEGE